jgi:acyl-CoA reductase-like NAD-dependent aldehyde dehydrogenase
MKSSRPIQHATTGKDGALLEHMEQALAAVDEWEKLTGQERKELLRSLRQELNVLY